MLRKEVVLGIWQKYSGTILSRPERLAFYENSRSLLHFDEHTLRIALNFCKKEGDFSIKRLAQLATAVRRGTVSQVLRRSEKDQLIQEIIYEKNRLVPIRELEKRFTEKTNGVGIPLVYTEVERAWRIATLTLADKDARYRGCISQRVNDSSFLERVFTLKVFDGEK